MPAGRTVTWRDPVRSTPERDRSTLVRQGTEHGRGCMPPVRAIEPPERDVTSYVQACASHEAGCKPRVRHCLLYGQRCKDHGRRCKEHGRLRRPPVQLCQTSDPTRHLFGHAVTILVRGCTLLVRGRALPVRPCTPPVRGRPAPVRRFGTPSRSRSDTKSSAREHTQISLSKFHTMRVKDLAHCMPLPFPADFDSRMIARPQFHSRIRRGVRPPRPHDQKGRVLV